MRTRSVSGLVWAVTWGCLLSGWVRTEGASEVRITRLLPSDAGVRLEWTEAEPGWHFSVQRRESLAGDLWLTRSEVRPWPTPGLEWLGPEDGGASTGFYRVVAVAAAERGRLLESSVIGSYSRLLLQILFASYEIPITPEYGVDVHRIIYETVDPLGGRTRASGALALPQGIAHNLPLAAYLHGTLVRTNEAPSGSESYEVFLGVALASTGYAAALPDYLGLGDSPGLHPYHHARSEATAAVDFLRAVRQWCAAREVTLDDKLFVTGYSQGGHAAMALHRELEFYHADEFTVTASAPMAGAYDLSGVTTEDFLSGRPMPNPYYFLLLLASYQEVYGLANSLADLLAEPYAQTLPPLLDGNTPAGTINDAMTNVVTEVMAPGLLAAFRQNPRHPLRLALRDNDVFDWTPRAPMRLYHCSGDEDVTFANAEVAIARFHERGATQVQLIEPVPGGDHGSCSEPALLAAKAWFDSLR